MYYYLGLAKKSNCMKQLFVIDLKDYNLNDKKYYRPSVRGIIINNNGEVAMIYSRKHHFYKFPGGGIEGNETHLEALAREIKEETGMTLIPESVSEFGEVLKIQKGDESGVSVIHIQQNYYYICKVEDKVDKQKLTNSERDQDFILTYVPIKEAITANSIFKSDNAFLRQIAEREKRVLEMLTV